MNIFDRFSTHLREALGRAIRLATELNNPIVEPIHLFHVLSSQKGSIAAEILNRFKIDPKTIEQAMLNLPILEKKAVKNKIEERSAQMELAPFSPTAKLVIEKSLLIAQENTHNYIGTEHLLFSIIEVKDKLVEEIIKTSGAKIEELYAQLKTVMTNASQFPQITEIAEMVERMQGGLGDDLLSPPGPMITDKLHPTTTSQHTKKQTALDFFATNLTDPQAQKNIDPVIGRKKEIERMAQILCRRTKNNPVLLGDPGVGKTAIVEGLAKKIMEGNVPDVLLNKKIYSVDMGMLIAGTTFRGEFEARLQHIMEEVIHNPNIILFIDEVHNIVGAGSNQGTMDASNILKPVLARGQIRCIGATTPSEFKKYIENDAALERRFQPIYLKPSSVEETVKILKGIKNNYQAYHNLKIDNKALEACARLADRYITNQFLPDKAIDLLDETAAAKRLKTKASAEQAKLWKLEKKLEEIITNKEKAARNDDFKTAVKLKKEEEVIQTQITKTLKHRNTETQKSSAGAITEKDIVKQLSKMIEVPVENLVLDRKNKSDEIQNELKKYIIGQDHVILQVTQLIRHAQLQLSNPDRPVASFMFVGESGVGKTELANILANTIHPGQDAMIRLDMSEYNESFGVSKLLGSPAGYIGYKETNQFTDKIKINPHSLILFDEIDKAHADVTKLLLQILENGEITDSTGRKISLKHAIIVLTTTIGAEQANKAHIGFGDNKNNKVENEKILRGKLKEFFSPELINRMDKICLFNNLTEKNLAEIAQLEINELNERLKKYKTKINTEPKIMKWLIKQLPEKNNNAREARSHIRQQVENLISEIILNKKIKTNYELKTIGKELVIN